MKNLLPFLLLFHSLTSSAQEDSLKYSEDSLEIIQLIILNRTDSSLIAYAFTPQYKFAPNPSFNNINDDLILDSLLTQGYRYGYDDPYFGSIISLDSAYAKPFIRYLACDDIAKFLNESGIRFIFQCYGYATYRNYPELIEKYGIEIVNEGCVVSSSDKSYRNKVYHWLNIRNGVGWYNQYMEDYRKLIEKK